MTDLKLVNDDLFKKHQEYLNKQKGYDKVRVELRKNNPEKKREYNEKLIKYYHDNKKTEKMKERILKSNSVKKHPIILKVNNYISALNTGKILKANIEKLNEYHITYNEDLKRYVADKEYMKQFYKIKEGK